MNAGAQTQCLHNVDEVPKDAGKERKEEIEKATCSRRERRWQCQHRTADYTSAYGLGRGTPIGAGGRLSTIDAWGSCAAAAGVLSVGTTRYSDAKLSRPRHRTQAEDDNPQHDSLLSRRPARSREQLPYPTNKSASAVNVIKATKWHVSPASFKCARILTANTG